MIEISAGGVVYKKIGDQLLFLMIEDRYGKWTLAKGKQEQGETLEENALREVWEETGIKGRIVRKLETIHYQYQHPQSGATVDKEVHYYLMEAIDGDVAVQVEEISAVHWCTAEVAWSRQRENGYGNNDSVLAAALKHFGIEV